MTNEMKFTKNINESQPCEDCISREAVINYICEGKECYKEDCKGKLYKRCLDLQWVYNLPSVTPQYTKAEIQKMQEMEQSEILKAYEIGFKDGVSEGIKGMG